MTPASAARSFAITLAIAITVFGPGASGFAIDRNIDAANNSTQAIDLLSKETIDLSVRDTVRTPNDTTPSSNEDFKKATTVSDSDGTAPRDLQKTSKVKIETTLASTRTTTISSTTEFAKIPTISSDTVEVFDSIEDTSSSNTSEKNNDVAEKTEISQTSTLQATKQSEQSKSISTTTEASITTKKLGQREFITTPETSTKINQVLESSITANADSNMVKTEIVPSSKQVNETTTPMLQTSEEKTTTNNNLRTSSSSTEVIDVITTDPNTFNSIKENDKTRLPEITVLDSKEPLTTTTEKTKFTDPFFGKYTKYTTIIRKRVISSEDSTVTQRAEEDLMKAETSNTVVNFENAFNATPIPSLEKLRTELLLNANHPSTSTEKTHATEKEANEQLLSSMNVFETTSAKRSGTVETKRAGYIDNSEKTTTSLTALKSSDEVNAVSETTNETVTKGIIADSETIPTESPHPKKVSGFKSQSQLAEDALQEEFLKEEALQNFEENSKRFRDELSQEVKPIKNDSNLTIAVSNNSSSDDLSVQPIEKYKTTLYTVSPNYKPMKKLDVQPAKPFVRDPDDNSWRNESISSLGIVFKPKNSSKSFKEVLKNKTQIELNSLMEKTKDEVPDLRVRLEKIAEVRKTKKKKLNKDGEVIYTDYEESSSGETITSTSSSLQSDLLSSILSSDELFKLITPNPNPITSASPQTNHETTTLSAITSPKEDTNKKNRTAIKSIFSSLGLDAYTTTKPEKFFNAAEYYDTTDEYDADYVTMSNLDLKKFTMDLMSTRPLAHTGRPIEPHTTRPIEPHTARPIEPHAPERKPTLQYFPPREPQKVNVNHIDEDFERKVNLFTLKEPQPPFVTIPPVPIATERPRDLLPSRPAAGRTTARLNDATTPQDLSKDYYMTSGPLPADSYLGPHLDRGSYVIKHYKDFLRDVAKENEDRRKDDFLRYHSPETTVPPEHDLPVLSTVADRTTYKHVDEEEDYDTRFHKDVLTRFVDNFNQNSERFKVDFPILYRIVVHRAGGGAPAASRAFLKRYYPGAGTRRGCEPHCALTVELSPAYELHYYVPGQEEREESERARPGPASATPQPHRYGL